MFHMKRLAETLRRRTLAIALWALFLGSAFLMLKSSADPLPFSLRGSAQGGLFSPFPSGNQIVFDLSVGIIVSLFIYVLVVWLPEHFKRIPRTPKSRPDLQLV
jgi:hypothetical protein